MAKQITAETLSTITHQNAPVITTDLLAQLYGADVKHIQNNYLRNTERFSLGKHYFKLEGAALKELKDKPSLRGLVATRAKHLILWTERGAARHAKMLETDQAWEVFEKLEDCYFNQRSKKEVANPPRKTTVLIHFDVTGKVLFTETLPEGYLVETIDGLIHRLKQRGYVVMHKNEIMEKLLINNC